MKIHKEGYLSILIVIGTLVIINTLLHLFFDSSHFLILFIGALSVFTSIVILRFFRNPNRNIKPDNSLIISPADGKIVTIEETEETEFLNAKCLQVSIFMSVWNVHVNRYPVSGEIIYSKHRNGKYLLARNPKSSEKNEAHTSAVKMPNDTTIVIRQIAGIMARRVVCYAKKGNKATQGSELGFIKLGSRVDIFLPLNTKINIKIGDTVRGNKSILGKL